MPGASIAINQAANPVPHGTPGIARDDIWQSQPVVLQSAISGNSSQNWSFLDVPPGSAAVLTGAATTSATFTPDLPGTYRVQLLTNGGGIGNAMILIIRVRYNSTGSLLYNGLCLPAFGERVGEDNVVISGTPNARGYAPTFEAILAYLLTLSGGGGATSYNIDCTVGGVIVYAGPTSPFPDIINLIGTPTGSTDIQMPTGLGFKLDVVNKTSFESAFFPLGGDGYAVIPATKTPVTVSSDGVSTSAVFPLATRVGDVGPVNLSDFTGLGVQSIGFVNTNDPAQQPVIPIYGAALNRLDSSAYGITTPTFGIGPVIGQVGELEFEVVDPGSGNAKLTYGRWAISQSGVTEILVPEVRFASSRNTQATARADGMWGDTLTGPSAGGTWAFDIPPGLVTLTLIVQMRVVSRTGGAEAVGDGYETMMTFSWTNVAGVVTLLTTTQGEPQEACSASMANPTVTPGSTGTQASIAYANNAALNGATVVDVQIEVRGPTL